jgi:hypothetical protein
MSAASPSAEAALGHDASEVKLAVRSTVIVTFVSKVDGLSRVDTVVVGVVYAEQRIALLQR